MTPSTVITTPSQAYFPTVRREPSLVAYWRLNDPNGNGQVIDSGARYALIGAYQTTQELGPALIQDDATAASSLLGSGNAGFSVSDTAALEITGDLSLGAWIAPYSASMSAHLIGKLNSAGTHANPYALRLVSGVLELALGDGTSETTISFGTPPVSIPSQITATSFRGAMAIYLNGALAGSGSLGSQTVSDGGQPLYAGAIGTSSPFSGLMSEVFVCNGALSARSIAEQFNVGQQVYPDPAHYYGVSRPALVL